MQLVVVIESELPGRVGVLVEGPSRVGGRQIGGPEGICPSGLQVSGRFRGFVRTSGAVSMAVLQRSDLPPEWLGAAAV